MPVIKISLPLSLPLPVPVAVAAPFGGISEWRKDMIKDLKSTCDDCCTDSMHKAGSRSRIKILIPV